MPQRHLRSRSRIRRRVTLPGGKTSVHYIKRKHFEPHCPRCGQPLSGVPRSKPSENRKLNIARRRVWRPYGGQICHNCLKQALEQAARTF